MLHGAEVTAPRIDVKAAQLEITSPQNSYDYHSVTRTAGGSLSVPLNNPAATSAGGSFQHQVLKDHFVSTGKTLSGLYTGDQGIGIDVAGNTSLTAGVISSTASREKNHFNTGSLTAQNLENISRWQLESAGFQGSFGGAGQGDAHSWLGQVGQGMAANSMSLLGGGRDHNETTISHSAVSDNITINTTGISGDLSRDVAHANGALTNKFDAQKLQNQMQASQLGTQLVGEIVGTAFQKVQERNDKARAEAGLPPEEAGGLFSRREVARDILEAGGAAGIAALTGGNPAAAGVGTLAGKVTAVTTRPLAEAVATGLTGNSNGTLHDSIANMFSGITAAAGGAVGGLVAGRGSASTNALTGAAAAAAIEQYNDMDHQDKDDQDKTTGNDSDKTKKDYHPSSAPNVISVKAKRLPPKNEQEDSTAYVVASGILGITGLIPGLSEVSSAASLVLDLSTGHYAEAAMDAVGIIPGFAEMRGAARVAETTAIFGKKALGLLDHGTNAVAKAKEVVGKGKQAVSDVVDHVASTLGGDAQGLSYAGAGAGAGASADKLETQVVHMARPNGAGSGGAGKKGDVYERGGKIDDKFKMEEFLASPGFGQNLKNNSIKTNYRKKGATVYKSTKNITNSEGEVLLKKGDYFYVDTLHKNHLEVYDKLKTSRHVLNLDGSVNHDMTEKAKGRRLRL